MTAQPEHTRAEQSRSQASVLGSSHDRVAVVDASATLGLSLFEVRAGRLEQRSLVGANHPTAGTLGEKPAWFAELGRYSATSSAEFGRLAIGVIRVADPALWAKVKIDAGMLDKPELPWSIGSSVALFKRLQGAGTTLVAGIEFAKVLAVGALGKLSLGFGGKWVYWMETQQSINPEEYMLFSFGPGISLRMKSIGVGVRSPVRIWLDKKALVDSGSTYPAGLTGPALAGNVSVFF